MPPCPSHIGVLNAQSGSTLGKQNASTPTPPLKAFTAMFWTTALFRSSTRVTVPQSPGEPGGHPGGGLVVSVAHVFEGPQQRPVPSLLGTCAKPSPRTDQVETNESRMGAM